MFTEPELIQSQRELLRQVRAANRMRTDVEQAATAKQKAAQQQAQAALTAATNQAERGRTEALAQASELRNTVLTAASEAQPLLHKANLGYLFTAVTVLVPKADRKALPALEEAAAQAEPALIDIQGAVQELLGQRAAEARWREQIQVGTIVLAVLLLVLGWVQYTNWQREQTLLTSRSTATAQAAIDQATATAVTMLGQATAMAIAIEAQATATAVAIEAQATATAVAISTATAVAVAQATATAQAVLFIESGINLVDQAVYVNVPAGPFLMGSEKGEPDEKPVHTVTLDEYWIMQTEVTNGHYTLCVNAGACTSPNNDYWRDTIRANHPVTYVDWLQATAYCTWAGARLPTEAEWEKAARGTDGRIYPWGNSPPSTTYLNHNRTVGDTTSAGSYPMGASPYGVLDMTGNVWEWTADWYSGGYYEVSPLHNPQGPKMGDHRVVRGGSWNNNDRVVRSSKRGNYQPDFRHSRFGFRCVRLP
jgi:formylglycine-generating enzyme required for sulfatase activity